MSFGVELNPLGRLTHRDEHLQNLEYAPCRRLWLKDHPDFYECWVRDLIAQNPSMLGLGYMALRQTERSQTGTGRLDLLLQNSHKRYVVEIMLGRMDESHIVRCIEYWDLERRRCPKYDHFAVLVAEETTARFLNVLSLITCAIPLIVLQMTAFQIENKLTLSFTKLLDEGLPRLEDTIPEAVTGREYWEGKSPVGSLKAVDECYDLLREIDPDLSLSYRKNYIGLVHRRRPRNFVTFRFLGGDLAVQLRLPNSSESELNHERDSTFGSLVSERQGRYLKLMFGSKGIGAAKSELRRYFLKAYEEAQPPHHSPMQMSLWKDNEPAGEWAEADAWNDDRLNDSPTNFSGFPEIPWGYSQGSLF